MLHANKDFHAVGNLPVQKNVWLHIIDSFIPSSAQTDATIDPPMTCRPDTAYTDQQEMK